MKVKTGYLYHIKDEFFDVVNDESLMSNHENGHTRPTYFTIKDKDILWFIPISSKIEKYQKIVDKKISKYGFCNTILVENILQKKHAILLQNAFPILEKYIDHVHISNGVPARVGINLEKEIIKRFREMLELKQKGVNLFFTNIDSIKLKMLQELEKSN